MRTLILIPLCIAALAACGGGGAPPGADRRTLLISDAIVGLAGQPITRFRSSCSGGLCTLRSGDIVFEISLDDELEDMPGVEVTSETTKGGVQLYGFQVPLPIEGFGTFTASGYGGWLSESAFITFNGDVEGDFVAFGMSSGEATGFNPPVTGGATWIGAMAGVDYGRSSEDVTGTTTLNIDDLTNPDIDIAFTGISGGRADMHWSNLSVIDGTFDGVSIEGQFYGPNAENVGGIFDRNSIIGAFGAQRLPVARVVSPP